MTKNKSTDVYVINPLTSKELLGFLDKKSKEIIKYFIIKSLFSQPEPKIGQRQLPIQIPKEHIEQWFTQALDVTPVGAGSYPIDIYNPREKWGADIKMLSIDVDKDGNPIGGSSGEASLGQKFSGPGVDLDVLFASNSYENIKSSWINLYKDKYTAVKKKYPEIEKIYYFFILRPGIQENYTNFYFAGASLNLKNLNNVTVNIERTKKQSVYLNNFISNDYGHVKIYKAKKRMELRLHPKNWTDNDNVIKIKTSFTPRNINLRSQKIDENYLKKEIKKMTTVSIEFQD